MTSTIVAVLVITLLVPGLALLFAVVVRFLVRGAPPPPERRQAESDTPPGS